MQNNRHLIIIPIIHTRADWGSLGSKVPVNQKYETGAIQYWRAISGYVQMLGLTEVLTIDKFPNATIVSGELARFDGSPVIVSEFVRNDLTTAGIYDAATVTDTEIFLVHTPSFLFGDVGSPKAESDRDIESLQTVVVTSERTSFKEIHSAGSGEETVGLGYSLTA